ncbi:MULTISPECIES: ECF transporter S component [Geobacillus]|jgi:energy-coupling factor transport system permease protein|uniref:ECF transporter S component n=1 Tax=Geobacillus thermodenitrificans TaxID=33940 RepID=A0ABY9QE82_GEOTD|nr:MULTISPECIES: ECF transporter S component [Geobacillus]ARA97648.1 thiamine ABC transporter permease [Geobacillus thermodenitrificans]KQB94240.1 thiamine ABC transporter permease [Geobacillus sp. PA-3]MEC5188821.1 energy-coupling factor transport system substrate-specific component [Geobacillus thermodenitrificans]MED0664181.1 thiamine ABC transporter permease [Geobacillus thermodenitrificans]PJW21683.1 thiamine ABC transporter permease [Geobacillus thermodenitrificans]
MVKTARGLKLADILTTIVIAIVFGVIYKVWSPVYEVVKVFGVHADQLVYGMWFIASSLTYLLIRKPGVALLAEIAASSGELIMGSQWGLEVLIYGVVQGLFAELVFAAFRYRRFDVFVVSLSAVSATVGSLIMDFYKGYIEALAPWNMALFLLARFVGAILISGVFAVSLAKALEKTGVTQMWRPASKEDYDALNR